MKKFLIGQIRKYKVSLILFYILLDIRNFLSYKLKISKIFKTGNRLSNSSDIISYINFCLNTLRKSNIDFKDFHDALEIGPGDNAGLSYALILEGVEKVSLIDKFQVNRRILENEDLFNKISVKKNSRYEKKDLDRIRVFDSKNKNFSLEGLLLDGSKFDLIYSISALEHIWPLEEFLSDISLLLSKDGVMLHVVNFTDHNMFYPEHGKFFFRTIPSFIYDSTMRLMGRPNRVLPSKIIEKLSSLGMKTDLIVLRNNFECDHFFNPSDKKILDEVSDAFGEDILQDREFLKDLSIASALIVAKN